MLVVLLLDAMLNLDKTKMVIDSQGEYVISL